MISSKAIIAVPFYNESRFLEETLACLKNIPKDTDVKFFICDNVSNDGSSEIAQKFAKDDKRFVYHLHDKNIGATRNFKFAFENSQSDYFMWLGAHDLIDPDYPQAAIEALEKRPKISFAAAEPYSFEDTPTQASLLKVAVYQFHEDPVMRYLQAVAKLGNCTILNSFFRRNFLEGYSWKETISWDHILISRILWHGPVFYTKGQRYLRRYFESEISREEKMAGTARKTAKYPRIDFMEFYVEDFKNLYAGYDEVKTFLGIKILELLEKRFGLQSLSYFDSEEIQ